MEMWCYNNREKAWEEIPGDGLTEINTLRGLRFTPIALPRYKKNTKWQEWLDLLEQGEALMISELLRSQDMAGFHIRGMPRNIGVPIGKPLDREEILIKLR